MTVSVVIPVYNRGSLVQQTLDSVLAQTCAPLEILVVDDGSSDEGADWIERHYGESVRVLRFPNGGVARARNRGWRAARGDWVAFLDHDDLFHPQKLEVLAPFLSGEAGVVVSRWQEIENGKIVRESPLVSTREAFCWLFGWHNPLVSMSVSLVRRSDLERVSGFDPRCAPADDWDLWLRLARQTRFAFCDQILTDYSLHSQQQRLDQKRMFRAVRRVLSRHPRALARRPLLLWWLLWSGAFAASIPAYEAFAQGKNGALVEALRAHPLSILSPQWLALFAKKAKNWARRAE